MTFAFPQVLVGDPIRHESLSVFPLFMDGTTGVDYVLADEAIRAGSVQVKEISDTGSVPELLVENSGECRVLFLEGEELVGAKQNRILNTSLLIPARSRTKIPVSCVEQGRWRYQSRSFASGGTYSPSKLRHVLRASVARSADLKRGHRSDQGAIWHEVAMLQHELGAPSDTGALSDTFAAYEQRITEYQEKLKYMKGASGLAVAVGGKVAALDVFDRPSTCRTVWNRLLSGYVFDSLRVQPTQRHADPTDVERLLDVVRRAFWKQVQPVGNGEEQRAETDGGDHLFVLSFDGRLVHGGAVVSRS